jgi:predicted protein tyrosine phosphatase
VVSLAPGCPVPDSRAALRERRTAAAGLFLRSQSACARLPLMRILFVCTANRLRSPTAAAVFADHPGLEVRSAALDAACPRPLTAELVAWADRLFVMEQRHREKIRRRFREQLGNTPVIVLGFPTSMSSCSPSSSPFSRNACRNSWTRLARAAGRGSQLPHTTAAQIPHTRSLPHPVCPVYLCPKTCL